MPPMLFLKNLLKKLRSFFLSTNFFFGLTINLCLVCFFAILKPHLFFYSLLFKFNFFFVVWLHFFLGLLNFRKDYMENSVPAFLTCLFLSFIWLFLLFLVL